MLSLEYHGKSFSPCKTAILKGILNTAPVEEKWGYVARAALM